MVEVDVQAELVQINQQLEQLVTQYNQQEAQLKQLMQQIQNLNGIAMYLRGKQNADTSNGMMVPDVSTIPVEEISNN